MFEPDSVAEWELASADKQEDPSRSGAFDELDAEQQVIHLFDELRNPLARYLLALGLPAHDAEEIVQEAFLALFQHLRREKSRENLRGWMFRVAHNLGLKRRAAVTRATTHASYDDLAATHPDPAENPEQQLLSSQRQDRIEAVLGTLPEQDRWCLVLRAEGLRYREIAKVLDISLGSVSASLARSIARLSRATHF